MLLKLLAGRRERAKQLVNHHVSQQETVRVRVSVTAFFHAHSHKRFVLETFSSDSHNLFINTWCTS